MVNISEVKKESKNDEKAVQQKAPKENDQSSDSSSDSSSSSSDEAHTKKKSPKKSIENGTKTIPEVQSSDDSSSENSSSDDSDASDSKADKIATKEAIDSEESSDSDSSEPSKSKHTKDSSAKNKKDIDFKMSDDETNEKTIDKSKENEQDSSDTDSDSDSDSDESKDIVEEDKVSKDLKRKSPEKQKAPQTKQKKVKFEENGEIASKIKTEKENLPKNECKISVRNLSFDTTEEQLRDHFKNCGEIKEVKMLKRGERFRGIAFILFNDKEAASKAVAMDGEELNNRALKILIATDEKNGDQNKPQKSKTLYMGNLSYNATDEDIAGFFETVGGITSIRLVTDKETQKPRGFGYVEFETFEAAEKALQMNGKLFQERTIRLDYSANRSERRRGESRGGRRGGRRGSRGGRRTGRGFSGGRRGRGRGTFKPKNSTFQGKKTVLE